MVLPSWAPSTGTYAKEVNISKISISILTNVGKGGGGEMHGYNVHDALYQNYEICNPRFRGLDLKVGSTWPYCKNVLNFKVFFSAPTYICEKPYA